MDLCGKNPKTCFSFIALRTLTKIIKTYFFTTLEINRHLVTVLTYYRKMAPTLARTELVFVSLCLCSRQVKGGGTRT